MVLRIFIVSFFMFGVVSCRYKDNDKFVLSTVKHRIQKTWYLKKCVLNGITLEDMIPDLTSNTLTFSDMKMNDVYATTNHDIFIYRYYFDKNKKQLHKEGISSEYKLTITKLTDDELWLEGDRIINSVGGYLSDKIVAKYSSKK